MMKFLLVSRRPENGSWDRMLYEWSVIHVALMLTTPAVPRVFKRYVQHYGLGDVPDADLLHPRAPERWESMADHLVETYADLVTSVTDPDYIARMRPHTFSSSSFIIMLGVAETLYRRPDFKSGGVKLVQWHKKPEGMSQTEFNKRFRGDYGPGLAAALKDRGLRKYEQSVPADLDPETFKGTLFARGSIGLYAGMDEIWLDQAADLKRIAGDPEVLGAVRAAEAGVLAPGGSFSMVMLERVAFDFITPGETTPLPAVLQPGSLESQLVEQEKVFREALKHQG